MKYSPLSIVLIVAAAFAIGWVLVAANRPPIDKEATTKCGGERVEAACKTCCNDLGFNASYSSVTSSCKCIHSNY
jgi:hypothetical protein